MNKKSPGRKATGFLLSMLFLISNILVAYAASTPDIQGGFSANTAALVAEYQSKYHWSAEDSIAREWEATVNGVSMTFSRKEGYQTAFYRDNIETTHLYIDPSYKSGSTFGSQFGDYKNIVTVALAELDTPESIESPLESDNVRYNTWYYNRSVHNVDSNEDGNFGPEDGASNFHPWSCTFISWCANECGYISSGLYRKTNSCDDLYNHMTTTNGFDAYSVSESVPMGGPGYTPVPGDLMFFASTDGNGFAHIGLVVEVESEGFYLVEGDFNSGVYKNYYGRSMDYTVSNGMIVHVEYPNNYSAADNEPHPDIIYAFLTEQMGMTPAAACGALGNMQLESSCIPDIIENGWTWEGGGGYGIIQWTNTHPNGRTYAGTLLSEGDTFYYQDGLRRTNLVNYCVTHGLDYKSLYGQLAFLQEEMNHYAVYSSAIQQMNACENTLEGAKEACRIWLLNIEGIEFYLTERQGYTRGFWTNLVH